MCHCHKTFLRQGFQRTGIIRTFTSSYLQEIGKVFRGNEKKKKGIGICITSHHQKKAHAMVNTRNLGKQMWILKL